MELSRPKENQLRVMLSPADLDSFSLTYASLDYRNVETKRAVWQILAEAKKTVQFDAGNSRLYIRAYPLGDGFCELSITALDGKEPEEPEERAQENGPITVRAAVFESLDSLTAACRCIAALREPDSRLYTDADGRLMLVLRFCDGAASELIMTSLCEFGKEVPPDGAGELLCEKDAAAVLAAI